MFDWSCPSLSASDSILLPIWHSRHSRFMQRHVPLLSHMHTLLFGLPILYISLRGLFFFWFSLHMSVFSSNLFPSNSHSPTNWMDTVSNLSGGNYTGADGHADIGCQVYPNTNTLPSTSSHKCLTKRWHRCISRPRQMELHTSSFSFVESTQTMWAFGHRWPARVTEKDSTMFWTKDIGVDTAHMSDRTLFLVLEIV